MVHVWKAGERRRILQLHHALFVSQNSFKSGRNDIEVDESVLVTLAIKFFRSTPDFLESQSNWANALGALLRKIRPSDSI